MSDTSEVRGTRTEDWTGTTCEICKTRLRTNGCCADARNEYDRVAELCHVLMNFYRHDGHTNACIVAASETCLETCRRGRAALIAEGYWTGELPAVQRD